MCCENKILNFLVFLLAFNTIKFQTDFLHSFDLCYANSYE